MTLCDFLNPAVPLGERVRHDLGMTSAGACTWSFLSTLAAFCSIGLLEGRQGLKSCTVLPDKRVAPPAHSIAMPQPSFCSPILKLHQMIGI